MHAGSSVRPTDPCLPVFSSLDTDSAASVLPAESVLSASELSALHLTFEMNERELRRRGEVTHAPGQGIARSDYHHARRG
jgi:hypothetical protein